MEKKCVEMDGSGSRAGYDSAYLSGVVKEEEGKSLLMLSLSLMLLSLLLVAP